MGHLSPEFSSTDQTQQLLAENETLSAELRDRAGQLAAINTVATSVGHSLDLDETLQTVLTSVLDVIPVDAAGISLVDEAADELVLRAQRGWKQDFVTQPMRIPLGEGMSGEVVHSDRVMITGDVADDPRLAIKRFASEGVQAMAMVPMHARGRVVGILSVMHYQPYEFSPQQLDVLQAIADQAGMALDNARLYESVKEQSSRLSAVLDATGDAIIATDAHGRINLLNAAAQHLFHLHNSNLTGVAVADAPLPAALREGVARAFDHAREGSTLFDLTVGGRYLSVVVSPVDSHEGHAKGWVIVAREVTHLRQAEQARLSFIEAAAHDLRNPLGATLSALKMLEEDMAAVPGSQQIVEIALTSVYRMQDLIDSLLNLEHIENGADFTFVQLDLGELIEDCVLNISPSLQEKQQSIETDLADDLPSLEGDPNWLYRALLNLLNNAHKYTPAGGRIKVRAFCQDPNICVEVCDNGPGIPADQQSRIFERFYRVPRTDDSIKGSGLGLAIVKSVAERHGGRVFVQSRQGQGSTFGLVLPLKPAPDDPHQ